MAGALKGGRGLKRGAGLFFKKSWRVLEKPLKASGDQRSASMSVGVVKRQQMKVIGWR